MKRHIKWVSKPKTIMKVKTNRNGKKKLEKFGTQEQRKSWCVIFFDLHLIDLQEWWKVYVHCVFLLPVLEHRYICALKDTNAHKSSTSVRKRLFTVLDNLLFVKSSLAGVRWNCFSLSVKFWVRRGWIYMCFFFLKMLPKLLTASVYWFCVLVNIDIQSMNLSIIWTTNGYACLSHQNAHSNTFIYL